MRRPSRLHLGGRVELDLDLHSRRNQKQSEAKQIPSRRASAHLELDLYLRVIRHVLRVELRGLIEVEAYDKRLGRRVGARPDRLCLGRQLGGHLLRQQGDEQPPLAALVHAGSARMALRWQRWYMQAALGWHSGGTLDCTRTAFGRHSHLVARVERHMRQARADVLKPFATLDAVPAVCSTRRLAREGEDLVSSGGSGYRQIQCGVISPCLTTSLMWKW